MKTKSSLLSFSGLILATAVQSVHAEDANTALQAMPHLQDEVLESRSSRQSNILQDDIPTAKKVLQPEVRKVESNPLREAIGREELRLWQWMRLGEYDKAESKIAEMRNLYPEWQPPAKMLELLGDARSKRELDRAVATQNWDAVVKLSERQPGFFSCEKYYNLWALADARYAAGNTDEVHRIYNDMMDGCRSEDVRVSTFQRAEQQLPLSAMVAMLETEKARSNNRLSKSALARLDDEMLRASVLEASRNGDDETILAAIPTLSPTVIKEKDAGFALIFGWTEYRQENYAEAERWFTNAHNWKPSGETIQAVATIKGQMGHLDEAEALARTDLNDPLMRDMLAGILTQRAQTAFDEEDYASTLKYLDEAARYAPRSLDNEAVYGWSAYHLGQYDKAASAFEKAYKDDPQPEIAEGLYYSLKDSDTSRLEDTAREHKGPLQQILEVRAAEEAYNSRQYHAAYSETPQNYPGLSGIDSPALLGGMLFHFRSGESGTSRLDTQRVPILAAEFGLGRHLMSVELSAVSLSSGNLGDSAVVGTYPGLDQSYRYEPTTELKNGLEPLFNYRYEGRIAPYFSLGLTPSNAVLGARMQGKAGLDYNMDRGSLKLELHRRPVKESILSYTGNFDPYNGASWGGVDSTGFLASTYLILGENLGANVNIRNASLTGEQVADNKMLEFSVGAKKFWSTDNWEEIAIGPAFTFQRFDKNLSKFTYGHGGYFSPQQLFKYGGEMSFLSKELRSFVASAKVDLGYQQHKQDCAPLFPISGNTCSELYPETQGAGVYLGMQLVGMVQADRHAQLGGGMFYSMSPEFNEFGFMLAFRLTMDPRKSVLHADIPNWISRVHE